MQKILILLCACLSFMGCNNKYSDVPQSYHKLLDVAIAKAGNNGGQLLEALEKCPNKEKEAMAYIIAYMPECDLTTITSKRLLENDSLAYVARKTFPWGPVVPDSIFFNDVLPYYVINESRDPWRADFILRFSKYVNKCNNIEEAIIAVNKNLRDEVKVDYNTGRKKPDQSPKESMEQGMASCTGLAVLLVDALRSVGIPARFAGTASWHDNRGNHSWVEVWNGKDWVYTEFYYPGQLDNAWFAADAGKAIATERNYAIYATSYKPTGDAFPMVWSDETYVNAINTTQHYINSYAARYKAEEASGNYVKLSLMMLKSNECTLTSDNRKETNVDIFCNNLQIGGGRTSGETKDMNDVLTFFVEKNKTYVIKYWLDNGEERDITVEVKDEPIQLKAIYQ